MQVRTYMCTCVCVGVFNLVYILNIILVNLLKCSNTFYSLKSFLLLNTTVSIARATSYDPFISYINLSLVLESLSFSFIVT